MIKDMKVVLRDFEPMVKDSKHLWNGRDLSNFSARPREAWANWLITAVLQHLHGPDITFAEDKSGDGLLVDKKTMTAIPTEHVSALEIPLAPNLPNGEQRAIDATNLKIAKGADYAEGRILVVFFDGAGWYRRDKIREAIFGRHNFQSVFYITLIKGDKSGYEYVVTEFKDEFGDQSASFKVDINADFTDWTVEQITA